MQKIFEAWQKLTFCRVDKKGSGEGWDLAHFYYIIEIFDHVYMNKMESISEITDCPNGHKLQTCFVDL